MKNDSDQSGSPDGSGIGRRLKSAREAADLSLDKVAEDLKLPEETIVALEEDRFGDIGASVFVKGHLKQYSELVGVDAGQVLADYQASINPDEERVVVSKPIKLQEDRQVATAIAAVGILAAVAVAAYLWLGDEPDVAPVSDAGMISDELRVDQLVEAADPTPALDPDAQPEASQPTPSVPEPEEATALNLPPGVIKLGLAFTQDSWVEITDGSDRRIFYGLGQAGAQSQVDAALPIQFLLGNADGVDVTINGDAFSVPPGSREGNLARFVLTEDDF